MGYAQPGIIPQVSGAINHTRFWATIVFVDDYSKYCYAHLMRGTSAKETVWAKEAYERLVATHRARFCAYRADIGIFQIPYSRRQSKSVENISATVGWSLATKKQLLISGSRDLP